VIDPDVALILVVHFVGGPAVVVGRSRRGRQRVAIDERQRDRIDRISRNRVVRERRAGRADGGRRIVDDGHAPVDRFGEDALPLQHGRHGGRDRPSDLLALSLVVGEEERPVPRNRSAEHAAELVPAVIRLHWVGSLKVVSGVQVLVAEELEQIAVERVGPGLGGEVDHAAIEPAELGGWAVTLDLELLNRIDDRVVRDLPGLWLEDRDAVEEVLVGARPAAVDPRQHRVRRQCHARHDAGEHDEQASVQRQLHYLLVFDHRAEASGFGPHDRRVLGHDGHLFLNVADAEPEIDAGLFSGRESDAFAA
jgi:hypothetical protein